MSIMFFRRMRERTWTFWWDAVALRSRETPTRLIKEAAAEPPPKKEETMRESFG